MPPESLSVSGTPMSQSRFEPLVPEREPRRIMPSELNDVLLPTCSLRPGALVPMPTLPLTAENMLGAAMVQSLSAPPPMPTSAVSATEARRAKAVVPAESATAAFMAQGTEVRRSRGTSSGSLPTVMPR